MATDVHNILDQAWSAWQDAELYKKWKSANPGEAAALIKYRNGTGPRPNMITKTGQALMFETSAWLAGVPSQPPKFGANLLRFPRLKQFNGPNLPVSSKDALVNTANSCPEGSTIIIDQDLKGSGDELTIRRRVSDLSKPITVTQKPGVKISGYAQWYLVTAGFRWTHLDISGFSDAGLKFTDSAGKYAEDNDVSKCHIHDGPSGMGILSTHGINRLQIWDNEIHDVGAISNQNHDHGMYLSGSGLIVYQNLVYNCAAYCIQLYPDAPGCIAGFNTFDDGYKHPYQRGGLVYGSEGGGETHDVLLVGNVGTNAPGAGAINYWRPGPGNRSFDNVGFGNAYADFQAGDNVVHEGCIHGDPKYKNRGARDYHINADSAARFAIHEDRSGWVPLKDKDDVDRTELTAGCYAYKA